jgi:hypothetical protein
MEHELINNFDHYTSAFSEFGAMKERLGHFAMSFMTLAWRTCDTITWYAAREKAFDEAHPRPNEYADSVVRLAQMGEGMKDKAAIMRGGEGTKIFTNMYSWYSTIYNQLTETQPQTLELEEGRRTRIAILVDGARADRPNGDRAGQGSEAG